MVMKKIFLLFVILICITGCKKETNVTRIELNQEEELVNVSNMEFLQNKFDNSNVYFKGAYQLYSFCSCSGFEIDGSCFGKKSCKANPGKYVWKYNVCSVFQNGYCYSTIYNDAKGEWSFDYSANYVIFNAFLNYFKTYNIEYHMYSPEEEKLNIFIVKYDDNLDSFLATFNAIKTYLMSKQELGETNTYRDMLVFNSEDYDKIVNRYKTTFLYSPSSLYEEIGGKDKYSSFIENRKIDNDMFNCESDKYTKIFYSINLDNEHNVILSCNGVN